MLRLLFGVVGAGDDVGDNVGDNVGDDVTAFLL